MNNLEPGIFLEILSAIGFVIHITSIVLPWIIYILWFFSIIFLIWLLGDIYKWKKLIKFNKNSQSLNEQFIRNHNDSIKLSNKTFLFLIITTLFLCWWWNKLPWELFWFWDRLK